MIIKPIQYRYTNDIPGIKGEKFRIDFSYQNGRISLMNLNPGRDFVFNDSKIQTLEEFSKALAAICEFVKMQNAQEGNTYGATAITGSDK